MLKNVLLVGIGGSIGSMLRYIVAWYITSTAFPLATWLVNILGSFLIGLLMGLDFKKTQPNNCLTNCCWLQAFVEDLQHYRI
jgi:CrcB protein